MFRSQRRALMHVEFCRHPHFALNMVRLSGDYFLSRTVETNFHVGQHLSNMNFSMAFVLQPSGRNEKLLSLQIKIRMNK